MAAAGHAGLPGCLPWASERGSRAALWRKGACTPRPVSLPVSPELPVNSFPPPSLPHDALALLLPGLLPLSPWSCLTPLHSRSLHSHSSVWNDRCEPSAEDCRSTYPLPSGTEGGFCF